MTTQQRGPVGDARARRVTPSRPSAPQRRSNAFTPLLYLLPSLVLLLAIFLVPIYDLIRLSLTDASLFGGQYSWIGLDNFTSLASADFIGPLVRTLLWVGVTVPVATVVGFLIALLLNSDRLPGRAWFRVLIIVPWLVPEALVGVMWRWVLHSHYGLLPNVLELLGLPEALDFLSVDTAFPTVLGVRIWRSIPFIVLIALAALQSVPHDLYEAARLDGATYVQQIRHITIPHVWPAVLGGAVILSAWTLVIFDLVFVLTGGGPAGSTEIISITIYEQAFRQYELGQAAATAVVVLAITALVGAIYFRGAGRSEPR